MTHTFSQELPALIIDLGAGIAGFLLALLWGKATKTNMTLRTVRLLAFAFAGITIFGMSLAFFM